MRNPNFLPSTDPLGFDRCEFHQKLPIDILNFLDFKLKFNLNKKGDQMASFSIKIVSSIS
jgi:hypothetical protein